MSNLFEKCCNASNLFGAQKYALEGGISFVIKESKDDFMKYYNATNTDGEQVELAFCTACNGALVDTTYCDRCDEIAEMASYQD